MSNTTYPSSNGVNLYKGMDADSISYDIQRHLRHSLAKDDYSKTEWDDYRSVVFTLLDRLHDRWLDTQQHYYKTDTKRVYYLSMEYLIGRLLDNALVNLGIREETRQALEELGIDYEKIRDAEWDAGLGNGGLGRLAACFMDSMATLGIPGFGYGLRYDYGMFHQKIVNGYQVERADLWLRYGNPWDISRPEKVYPVHFYGETVPYTDDNGNLRFRWENTQKVMALAYDMPVPGYKNDVVNNLRLWKAISPKALDLTCFNQGEYIDAIKDIELHENITRVLYPNDKVFVGLELRLKQEYFLVSATLQDIMRRFRKKHDDLRRLPEKVALQCNDTHPNLAIPELMRILLDEEGLEWETAWDITINTCAYTNHTLLPEALEKWPVSMLRNLLPRHLQIIYEINKRFLNRVRAKYGDDLNRLRRMSIISEEEEAKVQMASLGIVGSHKINGVAELHSDLMRKTIFKDFYDFFPEKFTNKTNGITPRRWLKQCNPELATLISEHIGDGWVTDLNQLDRLRELATDGRFQQRFRDIRHRNKQYLAGVIFEKTGVQVSPDTLFDVQIKRIHEYKRQLLALLHTIVLYNRMKKNPRAKITPRTVLFSGKAAPGYAMAKRHIKLINNVGQVINNDPDIGDKLKCVFLNNYNVTLAERIIPASDLSEQLSTAGREASGTGNMKFALNGALTVGTLDGANIEIRNEVGKENIFIFGHTVDQIEQLRTEGYDPWEYYHAYPELQQALEQIRNGFFSGPEEEEDLFQPVFEALLDRGDFFMVLADFPSYCEVQRSVTKWYRQPEKWWEMAIHNAAGMGRFSSDRTICEYAEDIWGVKPVPGEPRHASRQEK